MCGILMELWLSRCATAWIPGLDLQTIQSLCVQVTAVSPVCQGSVDRAPKTKIPKKNPIVLLPTHPGENYLYKEVMRE